MSPEPHSPRQRPVVVIRDPGAETPPADLLVAGPDRLRRSLPPWLSRVVVVLLVLLVAAVGLVHRHQRLAAGHRDLDAVQLLLVSQAIGATAGQVPLTVRSTAPFPVTLRWLRVEQGGSPQQALVRTVLQPGLATDLYVDVDDRCRVPAAGSAPASVLLRVVTPRGDEQTLRMATRGTPFASAYHASFSRQCALLAVDDALAFTSSAPRTGAATVTVDYLLRDVLGDPVTVVAAHAADGLALRAVGVPAQLAAGGTAAVRITYAVSDCPQARAAYGAAQVVPASQLTPPLYVNLEARHTGVHQTPPLAPDLAQALRALVLGRCPG